MTSTVWYCHVISGKTVICNFTYSLWLFLHVDYTEMPIPMTLLLKSVQDWDEIGQPKKTRLTLIPARISNYIYHNVWDEIT